MYFQRYYKYFQSLIIEYWIVSSVLIILLFVGIIGAYKTFIKTPNYVYVKVKVGQNIWLSSTTARSSVWYPNGMHRGDVSYDFLGNIETKITDKKIYLWSDTDLYDIYLTLKVKATKNGKTNSYSFNREVLSVGSPIEIQFPKENVTGVVMAVSENPFEENLVEKTIYLTKRYAYPWEYDAIKIGSFIIESDQKVFTVLDKSMQETLELGTDSYGNTTSELTEDRGYITVKAKIKVKKSNNTYIFGEEKIIEPGRLFDLSLGSFVLRGFVVSKIE